MNTFKCNIKLLFLVLIFAGAVSGCVKLNPVNNPTSPIGLIPKDFNWKTITELSCTVKVASVSGVGDNSIRIIRIYNNSVLNEQSLIATGAATPTLPYIAKISLATSIQTIYVQEILPDGTTTLLTKNISGTALDINFGTASAAGAPTIISQPASNSSLVVAADSDGDGVSSGYDVDDSDPAVAFASYFPSASTWGTYAFEDLWPVKGDYDINDIVIGFRISYFTNCSNLVTKMRVDYNMKAAGSIYNLGAAFQLDKVSSSNVQSVSGRALNGTSPFVIGANGCENGVSLAVIPLLNNQKDYVSYSGYLNTVSGSYLNTPDKYVSINFIAPVQQENVAMNAFNMFIVANTRGCEIHLPSFLGTTNFNSSLATGYSLFPGDLFKNYDGMMWGIMIPEPFEYPAECSSIINAYSHFAEWATSGGTSSTDWYKPVSANQSLNSIYLHEITGAGPPTDFDGNIYPSVTIGNQVWMATNLNTTHYNDGTAIPNVTANASWAALTTGAYCDYNNNPGNSAVYGRLYNWYAVDNNAASKVTSNGGKNICPTGWHVPTETEWTTLISYLGGSSAGGKLKETGTSHWLSPNTGATNLSGFTALPGGLRYPTNFQNLTSNGNWWSSTTYTRPINRVLYSGNGNVVPGYCEKTYGHSVRCVKD